MTNLKFKSGDKVKIKVKLGGYKNKDYPEKGEICTLLKTDEINSDGSIVWVFAEYPKAKMANKNIQSELNRWFELVYEDKDEKETEMLKYEDIVEGAEIECIETVELNNAKFTKGHIYKVEVYKHIYKHINETLLINTDQPKDGYDNYAYLKSNCDLSDRYKYFKLVKRETEMTNTPVLLDPEIYAVGTIHKDKNGTVYKIIARDIPSNNFKSGVMLICMDIDDESLKSFDQNTGQIAYSGTCSYDLVITKKKIKYWISFYKTDAFAYVSLHETKENADNPKIPNRIACIQVEFEEGEGL